MLTGQTVFVTARVRKPGPSCRSGRRGSARSLGEQVDIADVIVEAFSVAPSHHLDTRRGASLEIIGAAQLRRTRALVGVSRPACCCRTWCWRPTRSPPRRSSPRA